MRFRIIYLSFFILFGVTVFAQNDSLKYSTTTNFYLSEIPLSRADMYLSDKLEVYFNLPNNHQLVEVSKLKSPQAEHRTFFHYIDGQKVLYSGVKVHLKKDKSVVIQSYLTTLPVKEFVAGLNYLIPLKDGLVSVIKIEDNLNPTPQFIYTDKDGLEVFRQNQARYFKKDTVVYGTVFKINPINSANTVYGGIYTDRNDSNYLELQNEMSWVSMPAKFEDDTFYLESEVMRFESIFPPIEVNNYQQISDSFHFNRDDYRFEAFNAYYHINKVGSYINSMGHKGLTDTIKVDVHGFGDADKSAYYPDDHSIRFGDGGVDDAEDGEVIIHEYTHGLSEKASPETNFGTNRESIDEGICDYFCKAYSRIYNDNNPNRVFTWDGWNEFWQGAEINTQKYYPADLKNQLYEDRDFWSSLLMCFHDDVGRITADSLILEHMYYLTPNAKMHEMAEILIKIDSADFGGRYYSNLMNCMEPAGFRKYGVGIPINETLKEFVTIKNSFAFMQGVDDLVIELKASSKWFLHDINGKLIEESEGNQVRLKPSNYSKGIYIFSTVLQNEYISFKILR